MPKIVDHAERRSEIVVALWSTIYAEGISGVSFAAVARHGGISIGRIQHYFATKRDLVLAGVRAIVAAAEEDFRSTPEGSEHIGDEPARSSRATPIDEGDATDHAVDTLRSLLTGQIPETQEARIGSAVWSAYLAASMADREIAAVVHDALGGTRELIAQLVAQIRPDLAHAEVGTLALRLSALRDGLAHQVLHGTAAPESARTVIESEIAALTSRG
ncbi:TetR/AcrR family transcriptional regulator [Brevibacterium ihuae]|uniref:TetR/AcrR family transcriptional regulator n=1 Tax=Brevibacterium ihuae TaxID=1631743 RepID=UPI0015E0DE1A|nr:TetR/AcrR family transcriptional regulator [Brevibacterium ihuae]